MPDLKRFRPTVRRTRALEAEVRELQGDVQHWQRIASLAEEVRVRYSAQLLAAVFAKKNPEETVWLDETDHAAVSSAPVALAGKPGTYSLDGGSLGRGSGNLTFRVDVGGVTYYARRK